MSKGDRAAGRRKGLGVVGKLVVAVSLCVILVMAAFIWVVYNDMRSILVTENEHLLSAMTNGVAQEAEGWVSQVLTSLELERDVLEFDGRTTSNDAMLEYILHTVNRNAAYPAGLYVAIVDGPLLHATFVPDETYDVTTKSWYQNGLKSPDFILGDVYFDSDSQSNVVGASGQLHDAEGNVIGVAAADVYLTPISGLVDDARLNETGRVFLVDKRTDTIIGSPDAAVVGQTLASQSGAPLYAEAASLISSGQTGITKAAGYYLDVESIPNSDWVVVSHIDESEVMASARHLVLVMLVMGAITYVALVVLITVMARRIIGRPVREFSEAASKIADGDMDARVTFHSNDELGLLADDFRKVADRLRMYMRHIVEIESKLKQIADGDLTYTIDSQYTGEFARIQASLERISKELNGTMGHLKSASRDVAAGASQVSHDAMTLSQGTSRQAADVDAMAQNIGEVTTSVSQIEKGTSVAQSLSRDVRNVLVDSKHKMDSMTRIIENISAQSTEIHQIVKTIEDIAFQTNILALNAAVEAARAGSSGKGFAVVADEVRTLARRSSEAAKETSDLLSQTVDSMGQSVTAAQSAGDALTTAVDQAERMDKLLSEIASYTKAQSKNASDIQSGISAISNVNQQTVASIEASAAASEELNGQAEMLQKIVEHFKTKEGF